jgi:hypothetical protein
MTAAKRLEGMATRIIAPLWLLIVSFQSGPGSFQFAIRDTDARGLLGSAETLLCTNLQIFDLLVIWLVST